MNSMNFREFIRFGFQQNIVPALMPPEKLVLIFRQLIRDMQFNLTTNQDTYIGDNVRAQVLTYDWFKQALVRIAVAAQNELGGQREDQLIDFLSKEGMKRKEEDKKKDDRKRKEKEKVNQEKQMKEEMRKEYLQEEQQKAQILGKSPNLVKKKVEEVEETTQEMEISLQKKANEDAFFDKWIKQRQAQGISLKKRIIGREKDMGTKKVVKKSKKKVTKTTKQSKTNLDDNAEAAEEEVGEEEGE